MVKDETILILAGVGIVGYGLLKSDFFEGVGDVGTGVGSAVAGAGDFVRETFQSGGEVIRETTNQVREIVQTTGEDVVVPLLQNTGGITQSLTGTRGLRGAVDYELSAIKGLFYDVPRTLGQKFVELRNRPAPAPITFSESVVGRGISVISNFAGAAFAKVEDKGQVELGTESASGGMVVLPSDNRGIQKGLNVTGTRGRSVSIRSSSRPASTPSVLSSARNIRTTINERLPTPAQVISSGVGRATSLLRRVFRR